MAELTASELAVALDMLPHHAHALLEHLRLKGVAHCVGHRPSVRGRAPAVYSVPEVIQLKLKQPSTASSGT